MIAEFLWWVIIIVVTTVFSCNSISMVKNNYTIKVTWQCHALELTLLEKNKCFCFVDCSFVCFMKREANIWFVLAILLAFPFLKETSVHYGVAWLNVTLKKPIYKKQCLVIVSWILTDSCILFHFILLQSSCAAVGLWTSVFLITAYCRLFWKSRLVQDESHLWCSNLMVYH